MVAMGARQYSVVALLAVVVCVAQPHWGLADEQGNSDVSSFQGVLSCC